MIKTVLKVVVIILIIVPNVLNAQKNLITKAGFISFYSQTPAEDVEAKNAQVFSSINLQTGVVSFAVLIKGFVFENALMQKHFNEPDYMHSDKFPKATFKGKIKNFSAIPQNKNVEFPIEVEGRLEIHGVAKNIIQKGFIKFENNKITLQSKFNLKPKDFNISVPEEISQELLITVECKF